MVKDKKLYMIVNVASKWGFTSKNYKELVLLHQEFAKDGFDIIAFPCNQFGNQEHNDSQLIQLVAAKFGVEFNMMEKINVNGKNTHDIFKYLRAKSSLYDPKKKVAREVPWNFTKFLVSGDGKKVKYYNPRIDPSRLVPDIEKYLNKSRLTFNQEGDEPDILWDSKDKDNWIYKASKVTNLMREAYWS